MIGTLWSSAFFVALFPLVQGWVSIIAVTVCFAVAHESFRPANMAVVGDLVPLSRSRTAFALTRLAINLGVGIGPVLGGLLAERSYSALFWINAVASSIAAVLLMLFKFPKIVPREKSEGQSKRLGLSEHLFGTALSDRPFRWFLLAAIPVAIVFFQHQSSLPLFMTGDLGLSTASYGLVFSINTILIVLLEIPLTAAIAHWSAPRALGWGSFLFALGFGVLVWAKTWVGIAVSVVIWTFGEMVLFPAMSAYVTEVAPARKRGEYMGLFTMAFSVAFTFGPWAGNWTYEHHGAFALWAGSFALGLVSAWMFARPPALASSKGG